MTQDKEKLKQKFIEKATIKHNGKYDYSKVDYVDSKTPVTIICPEHGDFPQTPQSHLRGSSCPKCANRNRGRFKRSNRDEFILRAKEIHGDEYDYSKVEYKSSMDKVTIICKKHGEFEMTPMCHLLGQKCPKCQGRNLNTEDIIELFREKHGNKYDYSKVVYEKMHKKVIITCPKHGDFPQTPSKHLIGRGCPKCAVEKRSQAQFLTNEEFIEKSRKIHGDKYVYDKVDYKGAHVPVTIICPTHGEFTQIPNDHLCGHGCPSCGNNISLAETEISEYIQGLVFDVIEKDRSVLDGYEIDILVPSQHIGIEFDGLKWHSDQFKDEKYHVNKTDECMRAGIRLIHIFEDEWLHQKDIVKSMLSSIFGKVERKIYARKCTISKVDAKVKSEFLKDNHIQGDVVSLVNIGLFFGDELVSLMCFGRPRLSLGRKKGSAGEYELLRFCSKLNTSVIGGASKMFKYFIDEYQPNAITSYCDRRWSVGNVYTKLGFTFSHTSQPNYYYVRGTNRENRFRYRKSVLVKEGYDASKTEKEIMKERGIDRIYDCGSYVFKWENKKGEPE